MQKIISPPTPLLNNVEGFDEEAVNAAMSENDCRKISAFEFILLDSTIFYLSNILSITNHALLAGKNSQVILMKRLFVKLLLTITTLTEQEMCILLDINRGDIQHIKNQVLPIMESRKDFMDKFNGLIKHSISIEKLALGNFETHHNKVLTNRLRNLIIKRNN